MRRAVYPGSFDPVTNGHLDVIERAARLFDEVLVAVAVNEAKSGTFPYDQRVELLREALTRFDNVKVTRFEGLLVDFVYAQGAQVVIRGLRAISDFEFEFQMALMNRKLNPEVETMFLMSKEEYTYLSSRIVKEIAQLGGEIDGFVPHSVATALREKFGIARSLKSGEKE